MFLTSSSLITIGIKFQVFIKQRASFKNMNSNPLHFVGAYLSFIDDYVIS
jgi:hypothetical protein